MPVRQFPAKSQIVMVSPLLPEDIAIITRLRARGYAVMIVSPDPVAYEAGDIQAPAYRLAHAERAFMLRQLRRSGVQVVDWQVEQALEAAVRETLARQPAALHINRIGIS